MHSTDANGQERVKFVIAEHPDTENAQRELDLSALLDLLGYSPDEFMSLSHDGSGRFATRVMRAAHVGNVMADMPESANVYFGVNPVTGPARENKGRGTERDVTRLAAFVADLDVKPGACTDTATARAIIDELSSILGTRPSAITYSGGGLHPYWPVSDGDVTDLAEMKALLARWGRLVKAVAKNHGANADSVFDLSRVLRAPGTYNNKHETPVPVRTIADTGGPLTLAEVDERLNEVGAYETDADTAHGEQVSDPETWEYAEDTCAYVRKWLDGIPEDGPTLGAGRHQWVMSEAVRFSCARRAGCIAEEDYQKAQELVEQRLIALRAETGESVPPTEVPSMWEAGIERASQKSDAEVRAELGNHRHAWPAPDAPRDVAGRVVTEVRRAGRPWCYWNGMWFTWTGTHYQQATVDSLRDDLYDMLSDATYVGAKGVELRWKPNQKRLNEVIDAARGLVRLPEGVGPSGWIDGRKEQVIPCANGLLRVSDRMLLEHTPEHFSIMSLPYSYDASAVCPRWEQFLAEVFRDDDESVALLKQWFGYVLSGRTDLQKMIMWLGPMRGGKGTVARLLKRLVGERAYAGISVEGLRRNFALENLIDKSLVVFPDERQVGAPDGKRLVQFILQATGEDDVTVERKYKGAWSGRLPMRLMYMANEQPVLPDSSDAVQNRILTIETVVSFAGREDRGLDGDLAAELPGIMNWALDGLDELQAQGEFKQPESGRAAARDVDDFDNHVRRYLSSTRCVLREGASTECTQLWHDFQAWCQANGIEGNLNSVWFGRQLRPAMRDLAPGVKFERKRDDSEEGRPYYYMGIGLEQPETDGVKRKWPR
ncbi:hypothetical protein KL864_28830 [Mycolicibacterium goodii]|uniref:DNA primase family protein n=1 Tax=Mycolicibacterium goodii TaxID=134601 RepID=UPI001BDC0A69|nr:DNA primase family protein [Mycolicibacterium goodii]MBU8819895.1 hypothetical protein [Mycolicibacterium goodii]